MRGGLHSRIVRYARVLLPLAALALLSTLFLVADRVDPSNAIVFAGEEITERAADQQLTAPRAVGRTSGGTAFELRADAARPDPADPRRLTMDALRLRLDEPSGTTTIAARSGLVDSASRGVTLSGMVEVDGPRDMRLRTERLDGSLDALRLTAPGRIEGSAAFGDFTAGRMDLTETDGAHRLTFTGGVDLLYRPPDG